MSNDPTNAILLAEQRRCAAMLANDSAELDAVLAPQLAFHHANGGADDKAAYLAKMSAGRIIYISIDWSEVNIIPLGGEAALLTGRMLTMVRVEGIEKRLDNRVLQAWSFTDGTWRMIAFQSTPIPA